MNRKEPPTSARKREGSYSSNASILSEYLKLVEVASRLETYLSNRNASQVTSEDNADFDDDLMSVKEEAQLLMCLMSPVPRNNAKTGCHIAENKSSKSNSNAKETGFSLRCPSLSLRKKLNCKFASVCNSQVDTPQCSGNSKLCPSDLFARPLVTNAWDEIKLVAESMASNTMQSFITALDWRAKEWIKALAKCLHYKRELIQEELTGPDADYRCREAIKATKEALVIESIAQAAHNIVVRDIRATFNVLEQQVKQHDEDQDDPDSFSFSTLPSPPKKRKVCDGWDRPRAESLDLYEVSHSISLDLRLTLSTDSQGSIDTVNITAPGAIHGSFTRKDGKVQLNEADVNIDTQALAKDIEQKCRTMVRKVAESYISKCNLSSSEYQDEEELCSEYPDAQNTHISSDVNEVSANCLYLSEMQTHYPSAALITPRQQTASPLSNSSSDMETMIPPSSHTSRENDLYNSHEDKHIRRRVSPTHDSSCQSSLTSPKPSFPTETHSLTNTSFGSKIVIPSLVSPLPANTMENSSDTHSLKPRSGTSKAPSLPALVEVACAVINAS